MGQGARFQLPASGAGCAAGRYDLHRTVQESVAHESVATTMEESLEFALAEDDVWAMELSHHR